MPIRAFYNEWWRGDGQRDASIAFTSDSVMADEEEVDAAALVAQKRKNRQFKKFTFRGLEVEKLVDLSNEELLNIVHARARRRLQRGLKRKSMALLKKLKKAKTGDIPIL